MALVFTIYSRDPPDVVRDRLRAALTDKAPSFWSSGATFDGTVSENGFRISRNVFWERTLPIVAEGHFIPSNSGTLVKVTTRPQWWALNSSAYSRPQSSCC